MVISLPQDVEPVRLARGRRTRWLWWIPVVSVVLAGPFATLTPHTGLDDGWKLALNLAHLRGDAFGSELLFVYGPWGFVDYPHALSTWIIVAGTAFRVLSLGTFFWAVRDALAALPERAAWSAAGAATVLLGSWSASDWLLAVGVSALVAHRTLLVRHVSTHLWLFAGVVLPLLFLVKVSSGLVGIAVLVVALVVCRQWGSLVGASGLMLVSLAGWWMAAGQAIGDLVPWLMADVRLVGGYAEAMSLGGYTAWWVVGPVLLAAGGLVLSRTSQRPGWEPARALPWATLLILGCRVSLVRNDSVHFAGFVVLAALLVLVGAVEDDRRLGAQLATALAVSLAGLLIAHGTLPTPASWLRTARLAVVAGDRQDRLDEAASRAREHYDASPAVLDAIDGHPVAVDPWEIDFAWAYGLDWQQLPVFQPYSAFTPELDHINARALLRDPDQHVVREHDAIDRRQQLWDSPEYNLTLLCDFTQVASDQRWTVFARGSNRCTDPTSLATRQLSAAEELSVPAVGPDQAVVMHFTPADRPIWRVVLDALAKPTSPLRVTLGAHTYRLPRALAGQPCLIEVPVGETWMSESLGARSTLSFNESGTVSLETITVSD